MSYTLERFGDLTLPEYNRSGELAPAPAVNGIIELPFGAAFDCFGSADAPAKYPYTLTWNCAIGEDSWLALRTRTTEVLSYLYKRDTLWRKELAENSMAYCTARLIKIGMPRAIRDQLVQHFVLSFQVMGPWVNA